jgi:uncharacterized hydrophobic protein (TIGR00271 family)
MVEAVERSVRRQIERLLRVDPHSKPRIYTQVLDATEISSLNYWLELLFSAGIATFGLVLNSPAVVIGGMLISPLMGPILAAGLALAAGDLYLGIKALLSQLASVAAAVAFSAFIVWLLPFQSPTTEILSRTQPNLLDLGVALLSGFAGTVVVCRGGGGGGVTALPGVAIAVALMPPLCTVGFGVGSGVVRPIIYGAGLLFLTNLAAIVATAFITFLTVRMDAPDVREEISQSIREHASHDRLYLLLQRTYLSRYLAGIGRLRWRLLMLAVVLGALFVPLRKGLLQVRDETIARAAVRDAVRTLAPRGAIVSQTVDVTPDRIGLRLIVTETVPAAKVEEARRLILKRTGKDADLFVRKVAGEEELALLRERLRPTAPPPVQDLQTTGAEVLARLQQPLQEVWPADSATLQSYEIGFTPNGTVVHLRYKAEAPLDASVAQILEKVLKTQLHVDTLHLELEWDQPTPPPKPTKQRTRRVHPKP